MKEAERCVAVVAVSIDLGAGRRGVDMGPSALRIAGLGETLERMGYRVSEVGTVYAEGPETIELGETRLRFLNEIIGVARRSHDMVRKGMAAGCFPLVLGGDHSLSIGTTAAVAGHYREMGQSVGLIWVDAHADMNTPETTPSGNIHGMSLAVLTGQGPPELTEMGGASPAVRAENVCIIGARDLDDAEKDTVRETGVRVFTMSEIDEKGMARCMD
ncbi:MAG: arginase, partial [Gemmatimonadetes bacterium]|nr:arginase [Gemmatimonadota bacterium]